MSNADLYGNKRQADSDFSGSIKRQRVDEVEATFRAIIPAQNAGPVIGHRGSNISRIRREFEVTCNVPDSSSSERLLIIGGTINNICAVIRDVLPKFEEYQEFKTPDFQAELRMLVLGGYVGSLIGTKGAKINQLRERTGAGVKVFEDFCPNSKERVFRITGTPQVISDAVREILSSISETRLIGQPVFYDPNHHHRMDDPMMMPISRQMPRRSTAGGYGYGGPVEFDDYPMDRGYGNDGFYAASSRFGGGGGSGGYSDMSEFSDEKMESDTIVVTQKNAGTIIGQGGKNISDIRMRTGAKINIEDAPKEAERRTITLKGSQEQIQFAKYLIDKCVSTSTGPPQFGRSSGSGIGFRGRGRGFRGGRGGRRM